MRKEVSEVSSNKNSIDSSNLKILSSTARVRSCSAISMQSSFELNRPILQPLPGSDHCQQIESPSAEDRLELVSLKHSEKSEQQGVQEHQAKEATPSKRSVAPISSLASGGKVPSSGNASSQRIAYRRRRPMGERRKDRHPFHVSSPFPLNRVGQVIAYFVDGTSKKSSGTAISPSVVLTCAHSLIRHGMVCKKVIFIPGHRKGPVRAEEMYRSARVKHFFRMDSRVKPDGKRKYIIPSPVDFALFKLEKSLPVGLFPELRAAKPFSPQIYLYGYPNKFYENGLRLPGGNVTRRDLSGHIKLDKANSAEGEGYLLVHDMPTENGDSGSAIFQYF